MLIFQSTLKRSVAIILAVEFFFLGPVPSGKAAADEGWLVRAWQTYEGLPDNSVTGVAQTPDGYLWVATLGGLMRFNGDKFEEFPTLRIPGVPNHVVRNLFKDRRERLWLAMDRGSVVCVDQNKAQVFTGIEGLQDSKVAAMAEDSSGAIWVVYGNVFYQVSFSEKKLVRFGVEQGLPAGGNPWLAADRQDVLWLVSGKQVGTLRDGKWRKQFTLDAAPLRLCSAGDGGMWACSATRIFKFKEGGSLEEQGTFPVRIQATAMLEDRTGALWIGTMADGLFRLENSKLTQVSTSHREIACLTEDREGSLWLGTTGGGLNLLRPKVVDILDSRSGIYSESVRSICQDTNGLFWVAMNNGNLLYGRDNQWRKLSAADGWHGANATCVTAARDGGVWVGTHDRGLYWLRDGQFKEWRNDEDMASPSVRSLLLASNGDLWVTANTPNRLQMFRDGKFQSLELPPDVHTLRALAEGNDGTIWAGTADGQIFRVNGGKATPEAAVTEPRPLSIRALHVTSDGSLWIGYAGWGLGRLWNGHYTRITTKAGLYDDYISQILADNRSNLWFTGNHGLFKVKLEDLVAVTEGRVESLRSFVYGRSEGLPSLQPSFEDSPTVCRSADGELFFATRNGLLRVQPEHIRENLLLPPVWLERVTADERTVALRDSHSPLRSLVEASLPDLREPHPALKILPNHRKLEFEFAALSFVSPENIRFRHRLTNFDKDWIEDGTDRTVAYPRLSAGEYTFQVQASSTIGVWSTEGFQLNFTVMPFYWQTWWFRLAVLVLFTGIVAGLVRYFSFQKLQRELARLEQQAALQKERTRIARDMHDEVGTKLSRLSLLSELASSQPEMPAMARGDVAEISETARDTIRSFEQIVWAVNPKNDTLANLANYLCRFAEELFDGSPIHCEFNLPDKIPDRMLSTEMRHHVFLAAKEALNNALKYSQAKRLCVRLALTADGFEIGIEDDGVGFEKDAPPARAGSGNGMENMQARMKAVGGQFEIGSRPGTGTRVIFNVPLPGGMTD
jgi:signal transduction histidine kinase/ligand-binding sensor domain-containing protein